MKRILPATVLVLLAIAILTSCYTSSTAPQSLLTPSQQLTFRSTWKNVAISMERQVVKSVILRSAGYDDVMKILEIEFTSGQVYRFSAVPEKIWKGLMQSPEAGKYFSEKIRPKFRSRLVAGSS
ncbi:KTSC domain-containing protein [Methanoregula sp.]|uniref:KTSC domain-containing protein n=1 Tax=Methanoregula sp. TaxID=2052170 RepID=UPI0025ED2806|nr:KTSC domain-containing protein [Methanoregula sp.]